MTSVPSRATNLLLQVVALHALHLLASFDLLLPQLLLLPLLDLLLASFDLLLPQLLLLPLVHLLNVRVVLVLLLTIVPMRLAVLAEAMSLSQIDSLSAMRPWTLSITL